MQLDEAKKVLEENGYIVESLQKSAIVENLDEILLYIFGMENISKDVKSTVPGAIARVLDDDMHDVYVICDYNPDTDALSVCFSYGDFSDTFQHLSEYVDIDKDGKITMDDKLDSWATDVMSEWTDAFGY